MADSLAQSSPLAVTATTSSNNSNSNRQTVIMAKNIRRPQLEFEDKVDNTNTPFVRRIKYKPNALRPLNFGLPGSDDISDAMAQHVKSLGILNYNSSLVR